MIAGVNIQNWLPSELGDPLLEELGGGVCGNTLYLSNFRDPLSKAPTQASLTIIQVEPSGGEQAAHSMWGLR